MSTGPSENATTPAGDPAGVVARPGRRLLLEIGVGVLLLVLLRVLVVQPFHVPSASMEPTIRPGDRVVVTKFDAHDIRRGDVIVFDGTETFAGGGGSGGALSRAVSAAASALALDVGQKDYLKRVGGIGGDRLACTPEGGLVVNGDPVSEPYLVPDELACDFPFTVEVPHGHLFVLGDNRSESADSRSHLGDPGGGMVPVDDVVGHVAWRYWPPGRIGGVDS